VCDGTPKGKTVKEHVCSKKLCIWNKNMSIDAVIEGFYASESMHGLVYTEIVADGDTNVAKILNQHGFHIKKLRDSCLATFPQKHQKFTDSTEL
jgi:hypothetical protein